VAQNLVHFLAKNVYDNDFLRTYKNSFDLIILKDTIEHIPNQAQFIPYLKQFLKSEGHIFFGFPPWCMPFGGHQQVAKSKLASKLPYYHLLPYGIFKAFLRACGENEAQINDLIEVKDTGISTWRFEKIIHASGFSIVKRTFFLLNPIYRYKFNWSFAPIKQWKPIYYLPGLRDFITMCAYYLVKNKTN
jgi:SAM-dependent methyltransferase